MTIADTRTTRTEATGRGVRNQPTEGESHAQPRSRCLWLAAALTMFQTSDGKPGVRKLIIDTDPGVDDSWAILLALRSPEVEVIGITSLFGNVRTKMATQNALFLM